MKIMLMKFMEEKTRKIELFCQKIMPKDEEDSDDGCGDFDE